MANFQNQPRQSCSASFQTIYGIGRVKASRLSSFLLFHPNQVALEYDFKQILYGSKFSHLWYSIPTENRIRLSVESHLRRKSSIFCYQMYRLFQNLGTRGQRTKANANSIINYNPYKSLRVNLSFYNLLESAYKKRELLTNERYDELNAFTEALAQKIKMKKTDDRNKKQKARQEFIKKSRKNY